MQPYTPPTLETFDAWLASRPGIVEKARKTFRSGYRRILRDLHGPEYFDPLTLNDYRVSMKLGTRNVFNVVWKHLCELEAQRGLTLADPPHMPRVRFAHPLMHDVLTLSGYLNFDQLSSLTWGSVPAYAHRVELEHSLERVFEFQTGRSALEATAETPVMPTRHGLPMREWQVRFIANSVHHETTHPADRGARALAEELVHADVNGIALREYLTAYWRARPSLARADNAEALAASLVALAKARQYPLLHQTLTRRGAGQTVTPGW